MTKLEQALALAEQGFYVFPLVDGGKLPYIDAWQVKASRDPEQIRRWWVDPLMGIEQSHNIGISTSRFGDDKALLVIDVDNKNGKDGDGVLLTLELEGAVFPTTCQQLTPTGGRHIIYAVDEPVKQGVNVLGDGIDIRSRGGFIVAAGSVTPAGDYKMSSASIVQAPEWLIEACGKAVDEERAPQVAAEGIDEERAAERAQHYLAGEEVVSQGGRNDAAFKAAARIKDFGVGEAECVQIMAEHWKCEPMLEMAELQHVVRSAYRYASAAPGSAAPESEFKDVEIPEGEQKSHPIIEMNKEYAFVVAGGGHHILWETTDYKGRFRLEHLSEASFHKMHASKEIQIGKKSEPLTQVWMTSHSRRSYKGLCFLPGEETPEGWYNLWRGFAIEPSTTGSPEAQWAVNAWIEHLHDNVCQGDDDLAKWLTGYFAHLVQRPHTKPLVALVLRGGKGVGKNALIELGMGGILGAHSMIVTDRRYLVGNFNCYLENLLMITFDEAFWSGDKQAEGILKGLITGSTHVIEPKTKEPYTVENKVRVVIIGNEDWLVPASHDERRFAVFDVGDGRRGDRVYFERMRAGMEEGGYALLLQYLLDYDLSGIDINAAPDTQALTDQKHSSLEPIYQWWLDCLTEGWILGSDFGGEWPQEVGKDRLRAAFRRYAQDRNMRIRMPEARAFGRLMKKVAPSLTTGKLADEGSRVNSYNFGSLELHRKEWQERYGGVTEWD